MASFIRLKYLLLISLLHSFDVSGHTSSILTNQLPRFNIPPGNLSYFRSPYWEVLYLLKFKTLPYHSSTSASINRPLLQRIKSFLGSETSNSIFPYNEDPSSNSNLLISGESSEDFRGAPMTGYGSHPTDKKAKVSRSTNSRRSTKTKLNKNRKPKRFPEAYPEPEPLIQGQLMDEYDFFSQRKNNRIAKQTGENDVTNRRYGRIYGAPDTLGGEILDSETTINKKVNRKFQTQGWK